MRYLFLAIILAKCVFIGVPEITVTPFPFAVNEMREVSLYTYLWALIDISTLFVVVLVFWMMLTGREEVNPSRVKAMTAFLIVCGLDLLDYILRGNSEWFYVFNYPITNNVFMIPAYWVMTWE